MHKRLKSHVLLVIFLSLPATYGVIKVIQGAPEKSYDFCDIMSGEVHWNRLIVHEVQRARNTTKYGDLKIFCFFFNLIGPNSCVRCQL